MAAPSVKLLINKWMNTLCAPSELEWGPFMKIETFINIINMGGSINVEHHRPRLVLAQIRFLSIAIIRDQHKAKWCSKKKKKKQLQPKHTIKSSVVIIEKNTNLNVKRSTWYRWHKSRFMARGKIIVLCLKQCLKPTELISFNKILHKFVESNVVVVDAYGGSRLLDRNTESIHDCPYMCYGYGMFVIDICLRIFASHTTIMSAPPFWV